MRRTTTAASLMAGLILVSACSGAKPQTAPNVAGFTVADVGTDAKPASNTTSLAGMSALEVWEKTKADADASPSVHVAARFPEGDQFNLKLTDQGKVFGILKLRGRTVLVRRMGAVLYLKAGSSFWAANASSARVPELAGRWVTVRSAPTADLKQILEYTDLDYTVSDLMSLSAAEQKSLKLVPGIKIGPRRTIGLVDDSAQDPTLVRKLYLAAGDPAVPLNFTVGNGTTEYMKFRSWGKDFTVVAPRGAVELSQAR